MLTLKNERARLGLVLMAACCIAGLGACAPGAFADGSSVSRTTGRPVHARTVLKSRTAKQTVQNRALAKQTVQSRTLKSAIPLPDRSLFEPQPKPDCAFKGPLSNPVTVEETRMKLDYEQQCYRQAESITRDRLQQLQNSVDKTIAAGGTLKSPIPLPDRSLLEPQLQPDCTFRGPLSNPITVEETRIKLD